MLAQNRLLVKAKARVEEKAHFKIRELELRLEKANAVDERLRKEDAEYAVISQGASRSSTAKLAIEGWWKPLPSFTSLVPLGFP